MTPSHPRPPLCDTQNVNVCILGKNGVGPNFLFKQQFGKVDPGGGVFAAVDLDFHDGMRHNHHGRSLDNRDGTDNLMFVH